MDALLDFRVQVSLDCKILTLEEINKLLASTQGLALLRGKWVEVDPTRLRATLDKFQAIERLSEKEGVPFGQAMRLLAGAEIGAAASAAPTAQWAHVQADPWLAGALEGCRSPEGLARVDPGAALQATLRPYQQTGVRWLYLLTQLDLGACLADDMGLGKTIQVLGLLLVLGQRTKGAAETTPSLLVAPAWLLANWALEAARFTPGLKILVAHPSFLPADELRSMNANRLAATDLVVTSYATLLRLGWIGETHWRLVVLDEAQVVKNPNTKQAKAVKSLSAKGRIVLTGTPIENNLRDLWSIFERPTKKKKKPMKKRSGSAPTAPSIIEPRQERIGAVAKSSSARTVPEKIEPLNKTVRALAKPSKRQVSSAELSEPQTEIKSHRQNRAKAARWINPRARKRS